MVPKVPVEKTSEEQRSSGKGKKEQRDDGEKEDCQQEEPKEQDPDGAGTGDVKASVDGG